MGLLGPIFVVLERRRERRARWAFNHELDAYARTLSRVERPAGVIGGDRSMPMPRRAAQALPRLRRDHAKFREACGEVGAARDAVLRRLADPRTPPAAAAAARGRFDSLDEIRPTPDRIAEQERGWQMSFARLERWAQRDPEHAAALASRRAAAQLSASR
ncbi:MAG: hypothetical protein QOH72_2980 [Solirubrobacteraceae bacterium]|jgi:hypothetical protein|nr:hypothetical protein [Solirubrobacteraceae bacterium]